MATDPRLRASDEDRERTAALLREHHAVGRLTAEEFGERLDAAFAARTMGELDQLLGDLPSIDLYRLPDAKLTRQPMQAQPKPVQRGSGGWGAVWGCWLTVTLVCFVVWALAGFGYPWPLWVAGPWGAVLAGSYLSLGPGRSSRHHLGAGPGLGQVSPGPAPGPGPGQIGPAPGQLPGGRTTPDNDSPE
jgi:Domain of unknown function (DUF1707)